MKQLVKCAIGILLLAFTGTSAVAEKKHFYIFLGEETVLNDIENCVYEIMKQGVEVDESESRVLYEFAQGIILIYALKYVSYRTTGKIPESYSEDEAEILQSGEIDEFFEHCFE